MRIYVRRMYGGMKYERGGKMNFWKGYWHPRVYSRKFTERGYIYPKRAIFLYISSLSTFKKLGLYDFLIGNRAREISFKIVVELSF